MSTEPPQLSWGNTVATIGLALSLLGGVWIVMANQNDNLQKQINTLSDFQRRERDFRRTEIRELQNDSVHQNEFKELKTRIDDRLKTIQEQVIRLESTRPTTGELQGIAKSADETTKKLEDRVKELERQKP